MGYLTLRLYDAACEIPARWTAESLDDQRDRVLDMLAAASPMNAATFACVYALLEQLVTSPNATQSQTLAILKVFECHSDLRSDLETVNNYI